MKKIIALCLVAILSGCGIGQEEVIHKKKFSVLMTNDKGWTGSELECDSFNMKSKTEMTIWIDGTRSVVQSNELMVHTNHNRK